MVNIETRPIVTPTKSFKADKRVQPVSKSSVKAKDATKKLNDYQERDRRSGSDRRKEDTDRDDVYDMRSSKGRRQSDQDYPHIDISI